MNGINPSSSRKNNTCMRKIEILACVRHLLIRSSFWETLRHYFFEKSIILKYIWSCSIFHFPAFTLHSNHMKHILFFDTIQLAQISSGYYGKTRIGWNLIKKSFTITFSGSDSSELDGQIVVNLWRHRYLVGKQEKIAY